MGAKRVLGVDPSVRRAGLVVLELRRGARPRWLHGEELRQGSGGWTVLRFWESDIMSNLDRCVRTALKAIEEGTEPSPRAALPAKTFAEFFAGIGLMRIGLEAAGWSVCFANDIDVRKYEMYARHFGSCEDHYVIGDVHSLRAEQVPSHTLATASFPCNDLSLAGARNGLAGKQSSAYWGFVRVLNEMGGRRPPMVLLENVTGFLTSHGGRDFEQALRALNALGYRVDAFQLDAVNFVPQSRKRLFVVGVLSELLGPESGYYSLEVEADEVRPPALKRFIADHPEIAWHIRPLPAPPRSTRRLEDLLEDLPEDADEWWSAQRTNYLLNQMSERHRAQVEQMMRGPKWSYGTVFRRMRHGKSTAELRIDGTAGCLRTPRGGSARQILLRAGGGLCSVRFITAREAARLMGADTYTIDVPLNQALFGFGDAVCVPVISWIADVYLNPLVNELIRGHPLTLRSAGRGRADPVA